MRHLLPGFLVTLALALGAPAATQAASVAYIENGNVWLSSPDGAKKVQLTTNGTVDKPWLGVAQSATGVTAAAYSSPGTEGQARLVRYKLWDSLGKEVLDSSLASRQTPNLASAPLAMEISDDGAWVAQEYSYCNGFGLTYCQTISRGAWLGQTSIASVLDAVDLSSMRQATFFGRRIVSSDGSSIRVQNPSGTIPGSPTVYDAPLVTDAADWIPPYGSGQYNMRADVPASGGKVAVEILVPGVTPKNRVIAMTYGGEIGTSPPDEPNGCALGGPSVSGDAHSVAWSPDGTRLAWRDAQGLKVAGAPTLPWPSLEPCAFSSPPVLISGPPADPDAKDATGVYLSTQGPSFGGADVGAILAARTPPPPPGPAPVPGPAPGGTGTGGPAVTPPEAPTGAALAKGLLLNVTSTAAGAITARGTIPAKLAKRLGLPTTVATGRISAQRAGQKLKLRLRLTAKARRKAKRLKGATLTVRVTQGGKTTTLRLRLR